MWLVILGGVFLLGTLLCVLGGNRKDNIQEEEYLREAREKIKEAKKKIKGL